MHNIRRICFFAASFNPVHTDQLSIPLALYMLMCMNINFFMQIFVWTADNPLKRDKSHKYYDPSYLEKQTRQEMVGLAFNDFFTDEQKQSIMIADHFDACFSGVSVIEYLVENDFDIENPCDAHVVEFGRSLRRYKKKTDDGFLYEVWIAYGEDTANGINTWSSKLGNSLLAKYVTGIVMIPRDINTPNDQIKNIGTYFGMPTKLVPSLKTDFVGSECDFDLMIKGLKETNPDKHYNVTNNKDIIEILRLKDFQLTHTESFIPTIVYKIQNLGNTSSSTVRLLCNVYHNTDLSTIEKFKQSKKEDFANIMQKLELNTADELLIVDKNKLKQLLEQMVTKHVFEYIVQNKLFSS